MRFVLTYDGVVPSSSSKNKQRHMHSVRQQLHPQLKRQWEVEESLIAVAKRNGRSLVFPREEFRFIPLVAKRLDLVCYLDILMLRRQEPGQFIRHGGDIDNQIKNLFDSLRVPDLGQVSNFAPQQGETPFYCLLEDDALITGLQLKTERLLEPAKTGEEDHVGLIMTVLVRPSKVTKRNLPFLGGWL